MIKTILQYVWSSLAGMASFTKLNHLWNDPARYSYSNHPLTDFF